MDREHTRIYELIACYRQTLDPESLNQPQAVIRGQLSGSSAWYSEGGIDCAFIHLEDGHVCRLEAAYGASPDTLLEGMIYDLVLSFEPWDNLDDYIGSDRGDAVEHLNPNYNDTRLVSTSTIMAHQAAITSDIDSLKLTVQVPSRAAPQP